MPKLIYLDVCALCRPFDDQSFLRIRVETEAINLIFSKARKRAEELVSIGFGIADAAHVAFAEMEKAEFISCDKKLVKKCVRHKIEVWCGNPLAFCEKEDLK